MNNEAIIDTPKYTLNELCAAVAALSKPTKSFNLNHFLFYVAIGLTSYIMRAHTHTHYTTIDSEHNIN